MGIRAASGDHIFLCDDDIEPPNDYVQNLMEFLDGHPECGAASGLLLEPLENGEFDDGNRTLKPMSLLMAFTFQLSIWGDVGSLRTSAWLSPLMTILRRYYEKRGNGFTLAGWPLFTQVSHPACKAAVYGLGASIVRRQWLLDSPFSETLDSHGIGDNFGVAMGFPGEQPVSILPGTRVKHHKVPENRLTRGTTYVRRVLALDYFMNQDPRFSAVNRLFLLWSIFGHYLVVAARKNAELRKSAAKVFFTILLNKNPLIREL
jgi:glycosyltransferase involved in cell wall biosynthesis